MESEIWKPIKGYEDSYQISNYGRLKTLSRKARVGSNGHRVLAERIIKFNDDGKGYVKGRLFKNKEPKRVYMHQLVARAFIPNPENKPHINHIDGVRSNNIVTNLEWVTASENILHSYKIGLSSNKGENHSQAKLNKTKVKEIRLLHKMGIKQIDIAKLLGMMYANDNPQKNTPLVQW
jgi:hypothetical protein